MNKETTFVGKLMAMVLIIGAIVTANIIVKNMYANYVIEKTNEKYAYMETAEYKEVQSLYNEKYSR